MTPPAIGGTKPISLSPAAERAQQQAQKLHEAAQQFEGMLISTLWKSMENDPLTGSQDTDPGAGTLKGLGLQAMSTALAASGGLGFAAMIEHQLAPPPPPPPGTPAGLEPLKSAQAKSDTMLVARRPSALVEVVR
ncbi:MAG TPA: hypothetical protein VMV31_00620 [Terriglobales bacterium]|nr:hypothetical protein [Terriglobales bacterium]